MMLKTIIQTFTRLPRLAMMVAAVVLIYLLAWQFGIRKTVNLISRYSAVNRTAEIQLERIITPGEQLRRLEMLDRLIGCSDLSGDDIRQVILERLILARNSCLHTMVDIPQGYIYQKQDYSIMVNTFIMEGDYLGLLRLMYSMDTCRSTGQVITSRMYVYKPYQSSSPVLRLALYFQHLKKNK